MENREVKPMPRLWTVSQFTAEIKTLLEGHWPKGIDIEGEISGLKRPASGHLYFTLKDSGAQVPVVLFKWSLAACVQHGLIRDAGDLKDGLKVKIRGKVTVYAERGNYQIVAALVRPVGEGELMRRYLELKAKLEAEGLFDGARKRPLPPMPRRVAIVTSESGAVIHDMCTVLTRRFPNLEIRLYPSLVQGGEAPRTIVAGIGYFNRPDADWRAEVLIVARGGGSFEDLFCFNDEALVRAVAASRIPVISAVGHETDFTLCDFAADVRAGTPSIAAEIAVPVLSELRQRVTGAAGGLSTALRNKGEWAAQRVDQLTEALNSSLRLLSERQRARFDRARSRLEPALRFKLADFSGRLERSRAAMPPPLRLALAQRRARLEKAAEKLHVLSPYDVLERGYALVTDARGAVVRDAATLASGSKIRVRLARGGAAATVDSIEAAP